MKIYDFDQIKQNINLDADFNILVDSQRQAFIDFSEKLYEVPLPMQLSFPDSAGDCHIKAGFKKNGDIFVIKAASGFYNNAGINLPSGDGVVVVFCQKTGLIQAILYDKGWLTTLRTAIGSIVAASITPWTIKNIAIIGTGSLAQLTQSLVKRQYPEVNLHIWGRDLNKARNLAFGSTYVCDSIQELLARSDLVITTTSSTSPIVNSCDISGRKHIIAIGADDVHKQECEPILFQKADLVIVDSIAQACKFGDAFHAIQKGFIEVDKIIELGTILQKKVKLDARFIITDLTGIAPQDVAIAEFVLQNI